MSRSTSLVLSLLLSSPLAAQAPVFLHYGDGPGKAFARVVAGARDVDRDGYPDYIVGAPNDNHGAGSARVHSGKDGALLFRFDGDPSIQLGSSVASAGDVNRDGYPDPIVGAFLHPRNGILAGAAQVYSGKDGSLIHTVYGGGSGDLFGMHVAAVGDIDGDGHDDFAVGAPENGDPVRSYGTGYASVYSGRTGVLLHTFGGHQYGGEFGHVVIGVGDIDKDGTPDIMIGSTLEGQGNGSARIYSGRTKKLIHDFPAPFDGDHFGVVMAAGGDVDNDGYLDVIVGAPNAFSYLKGAVWVFSGRTGKPLHHISGSAASGMFGMCVLGIGDLDHDGHADFAAGDPMDSTLGPGLGSLRGFSGKDGSPLFVMHGDGGGFGIAAESLGDLNGDGVPELVCGTPGAMRGGVAVGLLAVQSLTAVATIGRGCSLGVAPRLECSPPEIGRKCGIRLSGQRRAAGVLFMSGVALLPTGVARDCYLHLDLANAIHLANFQTDGNGLWRRSFRVPRVQALLGAEFALQCAVGATPAPLGMDLSNGVSAVVQ